MLFQVNIQNRLASLFNWFFIFYVVIGIKIFRFDVHFDDWETHDGIDDFFLLPAVVLNHILLEESHDVIFFFFPCPIAFHDSCQPHELPTHFHPNVPSDVRNVAAKSLINGLLNVDGGSCGIEQFLLLGHINQAHDDSSTGI